MCMVLMVLEVILVVLGVVLVVCLSLLSNPMNVLKKTLRGVVFSNFWPLEP